MSESIIEDNNDTKLDVKKSDFMTVGGNILCGINFKVGLFLFFIGMLVFSDLFIDGFLAKVDNEMVQGECTTTKGTMVQLMVLVLCYIVIDLLVQSQWL